MCVYIMYILHVDSSMGISVQKLQQCPHSTNTQGYWDTIDYRDIFRVTIVIVKFSLSPSPSGDRNFILLVQIVRKL